MANFRADLGRYEYVRDTIQELQIASITVGDTTVVKELTAFRSYGTVSHGIIHADHTSIEFHTMTGNIPDKGLVILEDEIIQYIAVTWGVAGAGTLTGCKRGFNGTTAAAHAADLGMYFGSAFAVIPVGGITDVVVTIPFSGLSFNDSIPESGVVQIADEFVFYGGVTFTNADKTAGTLNYCKRAWDGSTNVAHLAGVHIAFEIKMDARERVIIQNNIASGYSLFIGYNPAINHHGVNAFKLAFGESVTLWVDQNTKIYAIHEASGGSGNVVVTEYR